MAAARPARLGLASLAARLKLWVDPNTSFNFFKIETSHWLVSIFLAGKSRQAAAKIHVQFVCEQQTYSDTDAFIHTYSSITTIDPPVTISSRARNLYHDLKHKHAVVEAPESQFRKFDTNEPLWENSLRLDRRRLYRVEVQGHHCWYREFYFYPLPVFQNIRTFSHTASLCNDQLCPVICWLLTPDLSAVFRCW